MAVRILPEAERRRRARAIRALDAEWTAAQVAAGVDGPTPDDRPSPSDYNQHVPQLEASGAALDEYFDRLDEILEGG